MITPRDVKYVISCLEQAIASKFGYSINFWCPSYHEAFEELIKDGTIRKESIEFFGEIITRYIYKDTILELGSYGDDSFFYNKGKL